MIRAAKPSDRADVEALLVAARLPTEGVAEHFGSFFVVEEEGRVMGAAGLEAYGPDVLLRSVVIAKEARGAGVGSRLTRRAVDEARARGARAVYLLTTTAASFFPRFGFERVARGDVPASMQASRELQGACPASAVVMRRAL